MSPAVRRVAFMVVGLAVVGTLAYATYLYFRAEPEEEDRPPIIVKGGSLRFISGDPDSSEAEEKNGKKWMKSGDDWQPNHKKGKRTKWFIVEFFPASAECPTTAMTKKITITYGSASFVMEHKARHGGGGPAPNIYGTGLQPEGGEPNPELIFDKGSTTGITRVELATKNNQYVNCPSPERVKVWQF